MELVDYISREPQQKAVNISTYDEQFIDAKLEATNRIAKRFLLNAENYNDFMARNPSIKPASNNLHYNYKNYEITQSSNTIDELTPNNSHTDDKIKNASIPPSVFCLKLLYRRSVG